MCGDLPPLQLLAAVMATVEGSLGVFLALGGPELRAKAALAGAGTMIGLVGFSLVANVRRIATKHCFCFGGIDLPWTAHAAIAGALALVFLAILLDSERRRAASA
jgi:hypothetical protein